MEPETVRTAAEEVQVRPATRSDASLLDRWREEPSVRRFQPLVRMTVSQLGADLAKQRLADLYRGRGERFQWIVEVDGTAAGWITLAVLNWEHGLAEVGYALSSPFQGRGIMVRALSILLAEVFDRTEIARVEARCAVDNVASKKVLQRVGFRREGRLRSYFKLEGRRVDNFLYACLEGDVSGGA